MGRRLIVLGAAAASLVTLAAGCGGGGGSPTTTTTATAAMTPATTTAAPPAVAGPTLKGLTPDQLRMALIVRAWVQRLNANDNAGLASLYSLPAIIVQGLYEYKLKTRKQVALWFSLLPCSGEIVALRFNGSYATVIFRLGNRGSIKCDGPGTLAAARFKIVNGKIAYWAQVPVPKNAPGNKRVA